MELNNAPHITIRDLKFGYSKDSLVLKGLSCEIKVGEKVAILGHNGAGKTTFFNVLAGLIRNYEGSVKLNDAELKKLDRCGIARKIALVPQKHEPLFPFLTRDFILMGRYSSIGLFGNPSDKDLHSVEKAAQETGADRFMDRPYNTLSGGEMQLALIARSLAQDSEILILDEPSTHLDFRNRFIVMDLVKKISETRKVTLLMSLHEPNDVLHFADRVIVMSDGRIVADGKPYEVINEKLLADHFGIRVKAISNDEGELVFKAIAAI
ncbi:MAG: ABC transporter ATP-binding protein [Candidatus Riflebacteria bacterium]|nr:ABC transporter ATP-binding protein [Candidatus Riflebacteria bacterium]